MCVKQRGYRNIKGSCLPVAQFVNRRSPGWVWLCQREVIASFHLDTKMGPMARFGQNIMKGVVSCHHITPTCLQEWWHDVQEGPGHCQGKVQTGTPGMYQATTLWQLEVLVDQGLNPTPVMVQLTARRLHWVRKLKATALC